MVYKSGELKGELTTPEIRKLISAHNKLTDIKIKKGATRDDILKLLKNNGWSVDHKKQSLIPLDRPRKKIITLKEADTITKPKPKTELQKQKLKEKKEEKEVEKKKEVREIKKKAIEEQKAIPKPVKKQTPKPKPKSVPKDSHVMADGSIMKNKDMKKSTPNKIDYKVFEGLVNELDRVYKKLSRVDRLKKYNIEGRLRRPFQDDMGDWIFRFKDIQPMEWEEKTLKNQNYSINQVKEYIEITKKQPEAKEPVKKNKDMPQKDSNPFIGKSTASNAKPTYKPKPKPKPKPSPKPKSVKPAPKQDTSKIDTYDKLSKFISNRTRKLTLGIGDWVKGNRKTKFKSQKELFKSADNFIKPLLQPLFDMIEKALEGDKPYINSSQYDTLDTLVERVREHMRDKRSELQKNIETEPAEEQVEEPAKKSKEEPKPLKKVEDTSIDFKKIKEILKESKYNFRNTMTKVDKGKRLQVGSHDDDNVNELITKIDKLFKDIPLVYNNVIFQTNSYAPNPKTGEQDGVYRKPKKIFMGKLIS